jgi:hypothetical protein
MISFKWNIDKSSKGEKEEERNAEDGHYFV